MTQHAIDRARERYGVTLTRDDLAAIGADIVAGRAVYLGPSVLDREMWQVHVARINFDVPVVWASRGRAVITVLPPTADQVAALVKSDQRDAAFAARRRGARARSR